jgi:heme oxygenase
MSMSSLSDQLRGSTRAAHDRLERLPFAAALADGSLPVESYVGYLRAMAIVHAVIEHELPIETDPRIDAVWNDEMRRLPPLQLDLAHFARQDIGDILPAQQAAEVIANRLLRRSVEAPLTMLGYLYVLEGSILGASVLGPQAKRAFGLDQTQGCAYLSHDARSSARRWQGFRQRLDTLDLSADECAGVETAVLEAYAGIEAVLQALYPFDQDALALRATTLNAEAGTHPIPQDPRELEAVREAGERTLREFPYFVWRYGERGRRFTDSDGGWLVTLVQYPQGRIDRQVAWLGQVLATRGMPRILLQRHLERLYEALRSRMPEPQADYDRLLTAADTLADARRNAISDDAVDWLAADFDRAIGADWQRRLPGSGLILIGAVADEDAGLRGALESTSAWFTDTERFPPSFVSAVQRLLKEAQQALFSSSASAR